MHYLEYTSDSYDKDGKRMRFLRPIADKREADRAYWDEVRKAKHTQQPEPVLWTVYPDRTAHTTFGLDRIPVERIPGWQPYYTC